MSIKTAAKREAALTAKAAALALKTSDAYSADRYGTAEWQRCAAFLLDLGLSARDAETVLRSKVMRWAGDFWDGEEEYGAIPVFALIKYMEGDRSPFAGLGLRSERGRYFS